jgi:regulator of sigma D
VPTEDITKFEKEFLDYVAHQHKGIYDSILSGAKVEGDLQESLENAIADFKKTFETSSGEAIGSDDLKSKTAEGSDDSADSDSGSDASSDSDDSNGSGVDGDDDTEAKADAASDRSSGEDA